MPANFDPTTIEDLTLRQAFIFLLNQIESQAAHLQALQQENQTLRDENNRLKGEQGQPKIQPNKKQANISSEKERHAKKLRPAKARRAHYQTITRTQTLRVTKDLLPPDVIHKGYEEVVVRELRFERETICFRREKYYSPSQQRIYLADLPPGFEAGAFGPGVRTLVISLYYEGAMSQPKIEQLLGELGCAVSTGLIAQWLNDCREFACERSEMERAGLSSTEWQGIDDTATRVNGVNQVCEVITNPLYTSYHTVAHKDRHTVLKLLCGHHLQYRFNEEARALLTVWKLPKCYLSCLEADWPYATTLTCSETEQWLARHLPHLGSQQVSLVWNALGLAYYHWQSEWPVVSLLVCDDAPQWEWLTAEIGLCWVHEARHYKKLTPHTPYFGAVLATFTESFWHYYRELLAYQLAATPAEAMRLQDEFERLFSPVTGYQALDQQIARTRAKQAQLLAVLMHPEIPLHNNASELAARQRVRKRDISFGPRSEAGAKAWDVFQSLAATCRKLGLSFYRYIHSRLSASDEIAQLGDIITERASQLNLSPSWATL